MYRIDNATAITPMPVPAAVGPNPDHFFTKGDPALGVPATVVDDDWLNHIQEEIRNCIVDAGLVPSKASVGQLSDAIGGAGCIAHATDTTATDTPLDRVLVGSDNSRATGAVSVVVASTGGAGVVLVSGSACAAMAVTDSAIVDGLGNAMIACGGGSSAMGAGDGLSAAIACSSPKSNGTSYNVAQVGCAGSAVSGTESLLVGSDNAELNDSYTIGIGPGTGAPLVPAGANQGIETKIKAHGLTIVDPATDATATVAAVALVAPLTYTAALDSAAGIITAITLGGGAGLPADTEASVAMTNNRVGVNSIVLATLDGYGGLGAPGVVRVVNGGAGLVTVIIRNFDPAVACNANAEIRFVIINPA